MKHKNNSLILDSVSSLVLKPGDILVIHTKRELNQNQKMEIFEHVKKASEAVPKPDPSTPQRPLPVMFLHGTFSIQSRTPGKG